MSTSPRFHCLARLEHSPPSIDDYRQVELGDFQLLDAVGAELTDPELGRLISRAERLGRRVVLCEAGVGCVLPAYAGRCRWRAVVASGNAGCILLLTDAARISYVWSWVEVPGSPWVEYRLPKRIRALEASFCRLEATAAGRVSAPHAAVADEVAALVSRRCRALGSAAVGSENLVRFIEGSEEVPPLRSIWKAIRGIRILDPDCESPDWIAARASALALIYVAVLERMRAWVDDLDRVPKRRPEHLRDFKEVVEAAESARWGVDRARWVRCEILRRSLFAVHRSGVAQERFRSWARGWAGDVAPEHLPLVVNSSACDRPCGDVPVTSRESTRPVVDVLQRSLTAARDAFGTADWTREELARAAEQIEHRRMLLLQQWDSRARGTSASFPLDLCFPVLEEEERLDLIRRR